MAGGGDQGRRCESGRETGNGKGSGVGKVFGKGETQVGRGQARGATTTRIVWKILSVHCRPISEANGQMFCFFLKFSSIPIFFVAPSCTFNI